MISGNRDEAWPMYLVWPISERFSAWVIQWHVTCMLSLAEHWQDRRALSNHVCAHSVISMWHVVCLQHLARACSEQSRSTTVLPINHVIQMPQCVSGFVNHDYSGWSILTPPPPWTKWPLFPRRYFQMHFLNKKCCILIKISLKFVHKGPINNNLNYNAYPIHWRIYAALGG